jgi:hypothetical protein
LNSVSGNALMKRRPLTAFWFRTLMRFGFCLMIVAFLLMGAEVAYALYQLAGMFL